MPNEKLSNLDQITEISTLDQMLITDVSAALKSRSKRISIEQLDARYDPSVQIGVTPLGEIYQVDNGVATTINTINVWEQIINYIVGENSFVTIASSKMTIEVAGKYLLNASLSATVVSGSNKAIEFAIFVDSGAGDVLVSKIKTKRVLGATAEGAASLTGLLSLAVDDVVSIKTRNTTDAINVLVVNSNLNIHGV